MAAFNGTVKSKDRMEAEDLRAALERSRRHARILYDFFCEGAQSSDLDDILDRAQGMMLDAVDMPASTAYLMKPDMDRLSLQSWRRLPLEYLEKGRLLSIGQIWAGRDVPSPRMARLDLTAMPGSPLGTLARHSGYAGAIAVPLAACRISLGVVCLFTDGERTLAEDEAALLEMIGGTAAMLIQNARYMAAVNEELRGTSSIFPRSNRANSPWRRPLSTWRT